MEKEIKIYHVETQEDYDDLMAKLEKKGYKWSIGENTSRELMKSGIWEVYSSETYIATYEQTKMVGWGAIEHLETMHPNETIIKYKTDKTDKAKELQKYSEQIAKKKEDLVNHPAHYNQYSQEVIDTIEEVTANMPVGIAYHVGNAVKYLFRAPFKGKLKQDLEKAIWYLERAVSKL